jgi:hypothetical protein
MTYLQSLDDGPSLLVDAGDVTAGPRNWEVFEMAYILKGYEAMGYDAVNAGRREASLGAAKLRELQGEHGFFVSANLTDTKGELIFPPFRVVEVGDGYRIGIVGVVQEGLDAADLGDDIAVQPAAEALGRILPELKRKSDFIVLLAFAGEEFMKGLAERFFEIDVIVGGDVMQPTNTPQQVNRAAMVYITDKGKGVGKLDIAFHDDGTRTYENGINMLLDTITDDPSVAGIVNEFKTRLAEMDFQPHRDDEEGLTAITAARSDSANRHVAAQNCAECHPKAVASWETSKHAHSFDSLVARQHQHNPRCLKCHTVGYGASDGYINQELTPLLGAVSCGNCHGRGDSHARLRRGEDVLAAAAALISVNCITCHDPENSPEFNRETYWEIIKHGLE